MFMGKASLAGGRGGSLSYPKIYIRSEEVFEETISSYPDTAEKNITRLYDDFNLLSNHLENISNYEARLASFKVNTEIKSTFSLRLNGIFFFSFINNFVIFGCSCKHEPYSYKWGHLGLSSGIPRHPEERLVLALLLDRMKKATTPKRIRHATGSFSFLSLQVKKS